MGSVAETALFAAFDHDPQYCERKKVLLEKSIVKKKADSENQKINQFGVNAREAGLLPAVAARVRHAKEMQKENDDSWRRVVTKMRRVLPVSVARQQGSW
jgi:hypothetical protein